MTEDNANKTINKKGKKRKEPKKASSRASSRSKNSSPPQGQSEAAFKTDPATRERTPEDRWKAPPADPIAQRPPVPAPPADEIAPAPPVASQDAVAGEDVSPAAAPLQTEAEPAPAPDTDSEQVAPPGEVTAPAPVPAPPADEIAPAPPVSAAQAETASIPSVRAEAPPAADQRVAEAPQDPLEAPEEVRPPSSPRSSADITPSGATGAHERAEADQSGPSSPGGHERTPGNGGSTPPSGNSDTRTPDPVLRGAKIALAALALLLVFILWASITNTYRYFMVPANGSVEIWQGDFSPNGRHFVAVLHGVRPGEPFKPFYRRSEIYPIVFSYYIAKADALMEADSLPDYSAVTDYLQRADRFALDREMHQAVENRRNRIQRASLLYRADLDAGRGTAKSLQSALDALKQARQLAGDPGEVQVIDQRIAQIKQRLASAPPGSE